MIVPYNLKWGHGYTGVGMIKGMEMCHHAYIFELYLRNSWLSIYGSCGELERKFGLHVSIGLIQDWLMTLHPFKGTMRVASRYPLGRKILIDYQMLEQYIFFLKQ